MNKMDMPYVVGVDVGGQTTKIGVVDMRGQVLAQTVIRTDTYGEVDPYIEELAEAINKVIADAGVTGQVRGIGMGIPNGNYYTGEIENAVNLKWGNKGKIPVANLLKEKMNGIPVALTNDANAAAMGEMTYGAARGMKNFIMITLGTGVGSGIVINGEVVYGHDGFAGELGHTCAVRHNGRLCNCGKTGCLETYTSATGVARTAREWLDLSNEPSSLRSLDNISSRMFSRLPRKVTSSLSRFSSTPEQSSGSHLPISSLSAHLRLSSSSVVWHVRRNSSASLSKGQ